MIILGLNAFHADASACLVIDGKLIAAAEEERFLRIKHWAGFPAEAIRYCLNEAGLRLSDVEHIALNQDAKANLCRKIAYTVTQRPDPALLLDRLRNKRKRLGIAEQLRAAFPDDNFHGAVHSVEHHLAHLSSAFHVSPFDKAVAVSVDGFGDFASTAWGCGDGGALTVDGKVYFPHSLGIFYQALTQFLGFPHYGDEYKIMGLAPYGEPSYLPQMRDIVRLRDDGGFVLNLAYFRHHHEKIAYRWENGSPEVGALFSAELEHLLGPKRAPHEALTQRHHDIARSVQAMYEEAFFHLLNWLYERYRLDTLTLAGGCAMNSVANGKIGSQTPFRHTYVQSAAGDAGGALGAAYALWHKLGGARGFAMEHAYWGPTADASAIAALLEERQAEIARQGCAIVHYADEAALLQRTAEAIADGKVIGWFQGRMEWGPRALGNRSILGDPRRADMKDILNAKIKRRESFRPFAPSILREAVNDWFEQDGDVPFMMQVFQIRPERRAMIPAVTHVDGSGRLQTVSRESNPRYYRLIEAFQILTGVPMLLNTSFNENEPVVCRPEEALDCFLRTHMDVLVLGDYVVSRTSRVD